MRRLECGRAERGASSLLACLGKARLSWTGVACRRTLIYIFQKSTRAVRSCHHLNIHISPRLHMIWLQAILRFPSVVTSFCIARSEAVKHAVRVVVLTSDGRIWDTQVRKPSKGESSTCEVTVVEDRSQCLGVFPFASSVLLLSPQSLLITRSVSAPIITTLGLDVIHTFPCSDVNTVSLSYLHCCW